MDDGAVWRYEETGSGRPLILLHGIGMSHAAWNAVTPYLRATRRVIAFDIAGFGLTPPLPAGTLPTIANLVEALERSLHEMGLDLPIDVAGNSLGGCMALEAARRGIARSVVAISPIGLWRAHPAPHVKYVFRGMRLHGAVFPESSEGVGTRIVAARAGAGRASLGGQPAHAGERCASCR